MLHSISSQGLGNSPSQAITFARDHTESLGLSTAIYFDSWLLCLLHARGKLASPHSKHIWAQGGVRNGDTESWLWFHIAKPGQDNCIHAVGPWPWPDLWVCFRLCLTINILYHSLSLPGPGLCLSITWMSPPAAGCLQV